MTLPAALQSLLLPGETILWEGKPDAPRKLSAYKGLHDLIARGFFALATIATVYFLMTQTGAFALNVPLLVFVGGPLLIGLIIREVGRRMARHAMRALHYVVTSKRIMINARPEPITYSILPDSPATLVTERRETDLIILSTDKPFPYQGQDRITAPIFTAPIGMVIPKGEGALAMAAIQSAKDMA